MSQNPYIYHHRSANGDWLAFNILTRGQTRLPDAYSPTGGQCTQTPAWNLLLQCSMVQTEALCPNEALQHYLFNKLRYANKTLMLTDALTFRCNLHCVYCFQQGHKGVGLKTHSLRPIERVHLYEHLNSIFGPKEMRIVFFGGEPFLQVDELDEILKQSSESNLPIKDFGAITNGTIFNNRIANLLNTFPFRFLQITLDGPPKVHDRRRPDDAGCGTFNPILGNIRHILRDTAVKIVIHTVIDEQNATHYSELLDRLMDSLGPWLSNKTRILFNLGMVSHPTSPCSHTKRYIPQQKKYAEIYLSSVNLALNKGLSVISCISDFICTYNKEYDLAIGPDGSIYKCISGIGLERFRVATLEEVMQAPEIFLVKQASFLEMGKGDLTCHKCRFFPVCGGGCVFNAYVAKREKDCWFEFHQVAIPLFVEILSSVQFVEPDVWVRKSNQNGG